MKTGPDSSSLPLPRGFLSKEPISRSRCSSMSVKGSCALISPRGPPRLGVSLTWDFKPKAQVYVSPWHRIGRIQQTLDSPSLRVFFAVHIRLGFRT